MQNVGFSRDTAEIVNIGAVHFTPLALTLKHSSQYFSTANNFLKLLAVETGGRYHRCHSDFDAQLFAHKLLTEGFQDAEVESLLDGILKLTC